MKGQKWLRTTVKIIDQSQIWMVWLSKSTVLYFPANCEGKRTLLLSCQTQCSQQNPLNHRDRISTTVGHFTECLTPSDLNGLLSVGEKQLVSVRVLNWLHAGGQSQWRTAVSLRFHPVCLWCTLWTTVKKCSEKYIECTRLTLWSAEWGNVFVCQLNILNGTLQCRTPIPMAIFVRLSLWRMWNHARQVELRYGSAMISLNGWKAWGAAWWTLHIPWKDAGFVQFAQGQWWVIVEQVALPKNTLEKTVQQFLKLEQF